MSGARLLRFSVVGAMGAGLQLVLVALLTRLFDEAPALAGAKMTPAVASMMAVSVTLVHNFAWHERYTFRAITERSEAGGLRGGLGRFVRFNLCNGLISLAGNAVLTQALVSFAGLSAIAANAAAIAACGLVNYAACTNLVFAASRYTTFSSGSSSQNSRPRRAASYCRPSA